MKIKVLLNYNKQIMNNHQENIVVPVSLHTYSSLILENSNYSNLIKKQDYFVILMQAYY